MVTPTSLVPLNCSSRRDPALLSMRRASDADEFCRFTHIPAVQGTGRSVAPKSTRLSAPAKLRPPPNRPVVQVGDVPPPPPSVPFTGPVESTAVEPDPSSSFHQFVSPGMDRSFPCTVS